MKDRREWASRQTAVAQAALDARPKVWSAIQASKPLDAAGTSKWSVGRVTVISEARPFAEVMSDIAPQLGVSVVAGDVAGNVTVAFMDAPGEEAVRAICKQVDVSPQLVDGVLTFDRKGKARESFGWFFPAFDMADKFKLVLESVLPETTSVVDIGGRVVVSGDRDSLRKATEIVAHAHAAGPDGWVLEVSLIGVSRSLRKELGLGWAVSGGGRLGLDAATGNISPVVTPVFGARAFAALDVIGKALEAGQEAVTITSGTLMLLEGGEPASMQSGEQVPVLERAVSPEGTVTTTGHRMIQTGFQLTANGRRVPDGLYINLEPSLSGVTGFVETIPIISQRSVKGACVVRSGEWMLLSGLDGLDWSRDGSTLPGLPAKRMFGIEAESIAGKSLLVLVRAERIYGPGQSAPTP